MCCGNRQHDSEPLRDPALLAMKCTCSAKAYEEVSSRKHEEHGANMATNVASATTNRRCTRNERQDVGRSVQLSTAPRCLLKRQHNFYEAVSRVDLFERTKAHCAENSNTAIQKNGN